MASGKSAIGKEIGRRTGWPHLDNDDLVEEAVGMSKLSLVDEQGGDELRKAERLAFDQMLEARPPLVASVAAGVLLEPECERALREHGESFVVWLRAPHDVITERIAAKPKDRPWIDEHDPLASVVALAVEREPVYERVAHLVVDSFGASHEEVASEILSAAARVTASKHH
jgi:shikimate kinase